ncbi:MAG: hypothetical protein AAFR68_04205 [Pseudomonadota bacterium]
MTTLEKVATYLRMIEKTTSLSEAQRDARLALRLIEAEAKK